MSTYLNRKSLMGCVIAIGLLGGIPSMVLAGEDSGEHSHATPAISTDKPVTTAGESKTDHGSMDVNLGKLWEMVRDREAWRAAAQGVVKRWTQLGD